MNRDKHEREIEGWRETSELLFCEVVRLDHRAHSTIQYHNTIPHLCCQYLTQPCTSRNLIAKESDRLTNITV